MTTRILRLLGACAAALTFATPASAFLVSLDVVGNELQVNLTGLSAGSPPTVNAYDVFINYEATLASSISSVAFSAALGAEDPLLSLIDTATAGQVEALFAPTLPNSTLETMMTDPLLLFTVTFVGNAVDFGFSLGASTFGCAAPPPPTDPNNANWSVACSPGASVPEPTSMALVALALAGIGAVGRRRPRSTALV